MATIKEIAKEAGVSIATVSHVINKTRYVSPELAEKVEDVIKKLGYDKKIAVAGNQFRIGKKSEIALLLPGLSGTLYSQLASAISACITERGYSLTVYFHHDDVTLEKNIITNILNNKRIAGLIIVPAARRRSSSRSLSSSSFRFCSWTARFAWKASAPCWRTVKKGFTEAAFIC